MKRKEDKNKTIPGASKDSHRGRIVYPNSLNFSAFTAFRREAVRHLSLRGPTFEAQFDSDTCFFDACFTGRGQEVLLLAPPLFNLEPLVHSLEFTALPSGKKTAARIFRFDRHTRIRLEAPADTTDMCFEGENGETSFSLSPAEHDTFAGKRVLFTLSKNNRLEWILDWIAFNRDVHGADAVLFYDNNSTRYDIQTLAAAVAKVPGIATSVIVPWLFRYGPQGGMTGAPWDSDFCQRGAWEHARWRFLQHARSAMNSDIDELVVSKTGRSVFEEAEASLTGAAYYRGRWIQGIPSDKEAVGQRHRDFFIPAPRQIKRRLGIFSYDAASCPIKWTVVPRRCPDRSQWRVHDIAGLFPRPRVQNKFYYLHFRAVNDGWKYNRNELPPNAADAQTDFGVYEEEHTLKDAFSSVNWPVFKEQ